MSFCLPSAKNTMRPLLIGFLCAAAFVACKKKSASPPASPSAENVSIAKEPTLNELNDAVQAWFTSRGQAPASFEELAKAKFISKVPTPPPGRQYVIDKENLRVLLK